MKIRTIIVDDEPLARERIRQLLKNEKDINVIAECTNGLEAIALLQTRRVDLIFLDVQMPEMDGFSVVDALDPRDIPAVIFVTAYDKFALRAFEVHALDYILKPIDRSRFARSVEHARSQLHRSGGAVSNKRLLALLDDLHVECRYLERLAVKTGRKVVIIVVTDIAYVTSAGNYLKINAHGKTHLLRGTMIHLERKLNPRQFVRIHRSTLVNIEHVLELQPYRKDEVVAVMKNGEHLPVSRGFRKQIMALISDFS